MKKLPPVFSSEGTVTAGNASGITDGPRRCSFCLRTLPDGKA
ncbi:MAG: hypothetical protein ACREDR_13710 [Blastocatellia bacterium]